jgi:hypothetical protein
MDILSAMSLLWRRPVRLYSVRAVSEALDLPYRAVVLPVADPTLCRLGGDAALHFVDGLIDEVRLSDTARTPQEIQGHYADATSP